MGSSKTFKSHVHKPHGKKSYPDLVYKLVQNVQMKMLYYSHRHSDLHDNYSDQILSRACATNDSSARWYKYPKTSKCTNSDDWPAWVSKASHEYQCITVADIFNCMHFRYFPENIVIIIVILGLESQRCGIEIRNSAWILEHF